MTEVVRVDRVHPDGEAIARAAACLRRGGLVAFPTETVYGLGAHAFDRDAVRRLFDAKGRPANDPLIIHVPALDDARELVRDIPAAAEDLAARFWPGPLTLVLHRAAAVPPEVTAGLDTVAVRVPAHPLARALLAAARVPVAAPSANLFSRPSPTRAEHVLADLDGRIDMVLDAGRTDAGIESTVVDLTGDAPVVLRPGVLSLEAIRAVVPGTVMRSPAASAGDVALPSPGLLARHYSPRTPLTLFEGPEADVTRALGSALRETSAAGGRAGVLATSEQIAALQPLAVPVADLGSGADASDAARRLYDALRHLDGLGLDAILAGDFPHDRGLGRAVRDRLRRAAARRVVVPGS